MQAVVPEEFELLPKSSGVAIPDLVTDSGEDINTDTHARVPSSSISESDSADNYTEHTGLLQTSIFF